ncbi:MAG: VanZ family protein [Tenuifilum sp.]|uniref:VanZ family protein n=1 Tax=Tenuifilum sp. TaxID=2760880 RepID=UPI0030A7F629
MRLRRFTILFLTIALWVTAILVIPTLLPINFPRFKCLGITIHTDYLVHVVLFVLLVISLKIVGIKTSSIGVLILLMLASALAEVWQLYIPHRTFNTYDLISNIIGVVIGYGVRVRIKDKG